MTVYKTRRTLIALRMIGYQNHPERRLWNKIRATSLRITEAITSHRRIIIPINYLLASSVLKQLILTVLNTSRPKRSSTNTSVQGAELIRLILVPLTRCL